MSRDWCPAILASEIESKHSIFSAQVEGTNGLTVTEKHVDCNKPEAASAPAATNTKEKAQEAACAAHFSKHLAQTIQKEKFKGSFQNDESRQQENSRGKLYNKRSSIGCAVMPYTGFKTRIVAAADDPSGPGNIPLLSSHTRQLLSLGNGGDESVSGTDSSSHAASTVVSAVNSGDLSLVHRNKGPFEGCTSCRSAVDTWELKSHNIFNRISTNNNDWPKSYVDDVTHHRHLSVEKYGKEPVESYCPNDYDEYLTTNENPSTFSSRDQAGFEDSKGVSDAYSTEKEKRIAGEAKDVSVRSVEHLIRLLLLNYNNNKSSSDTRKSVGVPFKHLSVTGGEMPLWVLTLLFGTKLDGVENITQKQVTDVSLALLRDKRASTTVGDDTTLTEPDVMMGSTSSSILRSIGSPTVAAGSGREAVIINYNTTKKSIDEIKLVEKERASLAKALQNAVKNLLHDQLISLTLSDGSVEPGLYRPIDKRLKAYTFATLTQDEREVIFRNDGDSEGDENGEERKQLSHEEQLKREEDTSRRVANILIKREKHFYVESILNRNIEKRSIAGNKVNEEEMDDGEVIEREVVVNEPEDDQEEADALLFKQQSSNTAAVVLLRDGLLPSTMKVPLCPIEEATLKREMIEERLKKRRNERRNRNRTAWKERKAEEAMELGLPEPGLYNTGEKDQEIPTFDDIELSADEKEDEEREDDEEDEENNTIEVKEENSDKDIDKMDTDFDEEDAEEDSDEDERFEIRKNNLFKKLHRDKMSVPPVLQHLQHLNLNNNPSLFLNSANESSTSIQFTDTLSARNIKHSVNAFDDAAVSEIGNNLVALEALRAVLLMSSHELKYHHCYKRFFIEQEKQKMREEKRKSHVNEKVVNDDMSNTEPSEHITFITDEDIINKFPIPRHKWYHKNQLRILQLSNTGLGSVIAIKYLAEGLQFNTSLRVLDLSRNALGGQFIGGKDFSKTATASHEEKEAAFIEFFANKAIRCNKHLEVLDLGENGLSGNMVKSLAIALSLSLYSYRGVPEGFLGMDDEIEGISHGPGVGEEDLNETARDDSITVQKYHLRDDYSESDEELSIDWQNNLRQNDDISADFYEINVKHPDDYIIDNGDVDEENQVDMVVNKDQDTHQNKKRLEPIVEALFNNETFMIPIEAPPKMTIGIPLVEEEKEEEENEEANEEDEEGGESDEEEDDDDEEEEEEDGEEEEESIDKEDSDGTIEGLNNQGDEEKEEEEEENEEEKIKYLAKEKRRDEKIWRRKMEFYVWGPECIHLFHEEITARRQDLYVAYKIEMTLLKIRELKERRGPVLALERRRVRRETKRSKMGWSHLQFLQLQHNPAIGNIGATALARALRHNVPLEGAAREHERLRRVHLIHFIKDLVIASEKRRILREMKRETGSVNSFKESNTESHEADNEMTSGEFLVTDSFPIVLEIPDNDPYIEDNEGDETKEVDHIEENNKEKYEKEEEGPVILDEEGCFNFLGNLIPVKKIIEERVLRKGLSAMLLPIPDGLLQKPLQDIGEMNPTADYEEEFDDKDMEETIEEENDQSFLETRRKAQFEKRMRKLPYGTATSTRPGFRSIKLLNLSDCGIGGHGIKSLTETIGNNCPSLQYLNISLNPRFSLKRRQIDEEDAEENDEMGNESPNAQNHVNRACVPPHIKYEIETVTPATLSLKTCISLNDTLTTLDISFCGLYPASIRALAEAFGINRTLKHLNLRGNYIGYIVPTIENSKRKPILPPTPPNDISTLSILLSAFTDNATSVPSSLQTLILDQNCLGTPAVSSLVTINNPDYVVTGVKQESTYTENGEKITRNVNVVEKAPQAQAFDQRAATLLAQLCNNSLDRLSIAGNDFDNNDIIRFSNAIFEFVMDKKLGSTSVGTDFSKMKKHSIHVLPGKTLQERSSITQIKDEYLGEIKENDCNDEKIVIVKDNRDKNTDSLSEEDNSDTDTLGLLRKPINGVRNGTTTGVSFCVNTTATLRALNIGNNPRMSGSVCGTALARLLQFMSRLQELLVHQCPGLGNDAFKLLCHKICTHSSLKVLSLARTGITTLQPLIDGLNTKLNNLVCGTDKKPLHLTVLDLSDNDLDPSSVEELCGILADNVIIHVDSQNGRSGRNLSDNPQFINSIVISDSDEIDEDLPPCLDPYEEDVTPAVSMERRASRASFKVLSHKSERSELESRNLSVSDIVSPSLNFTSLAPMLRYISIWSRRRTTSDSVCSVPTTLLASISRLVHAGLLDDYSCALTSRDGGTLPASILAGAGAISPCPLSMITSILQARGVALLFKPQMPPYLNRSDEGFSAAAVVGLLSLLSPPKAPAHGLYYPDQDPCDTSFAQIPSVANYFAALLDRVQYQYILKNRLNRLMNKRRELEERDDEASDLPSLEDLILQDQEQLKNAIADMLVNSGDSGYTLTEKGGTAVIQRLLVYILGKHQMVMQYLVTVLRCSLFRERGHKYVCGLPEGDSNPTEDVSIDYPPPPLPTYRPHNIYRGINLPNKSRFRDDHNLDDIQEEGQSEVPIYPTLENDANIALNNKIEEQKMESLTKDLNKLYSNVKDQEKQQRAERQKVQRKSNTRNHSSANKITPLGTSDQPKSQLTKHSPVSLNNLLRGRERARDIAIATEAQALSVGSLLLLLVPTIHKQNHVLDNGAGITGDNHRSVTDVLSWQCLMNRLS